MPETAYQLALSLETHRSYYLFSDHYLNELLPRQAMWREAEAKAKNPGWQIYHLYAPHQPKGRNTGLTSVKVPAIMYIGLCLRCVGQLCQEVEITWVLNLCVSNWMLNYRLRLS
jgi:hypothetical protein